MRGKSETEGCPTMDSDESRMAYLRRRAEANPDDESDGDSNNTNKRRSDDEGSDYDHGDDDDDDDDQCERRVEMGGCTSSSKPSDRDRHFTEETEKDQYLPIGERLELLTHGAGPSRRKRRRACAPHDDSLRKGEMKGMGVKQNQVNSRDASSIQHGRGGDASSACAKGRSRVNKNRPQEVSSSRAVGRFREVVASRRRTALDPRFEGGVGSSKLNYDIFRKAYGFLGSYQDSEIEELKKSLKNEKSQERSGRLQTLLTRLQQERAERAQGDRRQAALREAKKREQEAVAAGKKPYFLKGSAKKKLHLEQRYEELKEEGKLGKFMEKKRKKNAAKDHRWLPSKRQDRG